MSRTTRLVLILASLAAVVAALLWFAFRPVPVPVEFAEVTRGPMEVTVDTDGVTRIREVWEVSAPISGTAKRSPVRVGDPVVAGETVVAVVEPIAPSLLDVRSRTQAEAAVHEAEASLAVADSQVIQAREELSYAQTQFDRAKALVEGGAASLVRLEDAAQALRIKSAALNAATAAQNMAKGALDRARAALIGPEDLLGTEVTCCVEILAPATGSVLDIDRVSERPVEAGQRLLSVGDPKDLEIVADPLSRDAVRIPEGALAHVDRWGGSGDLEARLRRIEPSAKTEVSALGIEEQRVEALFDIVNPPDTRDGLGDGYSVRLRIVVWESADTLKVPLGAIFRSGGGWAAFRDGNGVAELVPVEVGEMNDFEAEVLSGLSEGDRVVAHPGEGVIDGALIVEAAAE